MNRIWCWAWLLVFVSFGAFAQEGMITIEPADASGEDEVTIIYDATLGQSALAGAGKVYMHSGVITDGPAGTDWQYVVGNWGQDDGVGEMTPVNGETDKWQITLTPRDYYAVPSGETIFRLSMVFRNPDGSAEGKGNPGTYSWGQVGSNNDIYIDLTTGSFVQITSPEEDELFVPSTETVTFEAEASSEVTSMSIQLDEGSGFTEVASVSSGTQITYDYSPTASGSVEVKVTAEINGESIESSRSIIINVIPVTVEEPLPANTIKGINYTGPQSAVLVLEAPDKDFVYVAGDFNNWELSNDYLMKRAPDSDLFWLQINGLTAGQKYVFQYWVNGTIRIGDPYADEIADADDDPFIPSSVFPDIAPYDKPYGPASVLQTNQADFSWDASENSWDPPAQDELLIYELLLRDFLGTHSYDDLIDTLDYLDRLGVNAIELMPVMEFEGNISWGYNPSYFFAVDKYYGTKNDFKRFVQAAHQKGIAIIMDMVLNHAFSESPLVRMYFEDGRPSANSPWFNQDATHPFNVGYDFNHESPYTQDFVDSVNNYWVSEYHIDGYRYDLSKGFTQTNNPSNVEAWSAYDASRIALIKRMAAELRDDHPQTYIILEHFAAASEEEELAADDMVLWRNMNFPYHEGLVGSPGDFSGATARSHVSYMESHDEERTLFEAYGKGNSAGNYSTSDTTILLERAKMNAAFFFTLPGPKMLWQFGELGYDVELNDDRLAQKPLPWGAGNLGYYSDPLRQYLYEAYSAILNLRQEFAGEWENADYSYDFDGQYRTITIDGADTDFLIIGNYGLTEQVQTVEFTGTGTWFDFFSGEEMNVSASDMEIALQPGEFHIYSSQAVSEGFENVVEIFDLPVSVTPDPFTKDQEITIRFDAGKANPAGTEGLAGAERVLMVAGAVLEPGSNVLTNLVDGAAGEMTQVDGETDMWQITLTPSDYFGTGAETNIYRLGMYFTDPSGSKLGKGFRGENIYLNVLLDGNMVSISPAEFSQSDEITITFDARFGSGTLIDAGKVYMHSGVVLSDIANPTGSDWSKVQGNWGQDDGIGEMTQVDGEPGKWEITITPADYYNLTSSERAFYLAMVFRNADGSREAKGSADMTIENAYIAPNGDIFMTVPNIDEVVSADDDLDQKIKLYPNPASENITLETIEGNITYFELLSLQGRSIFSGELIGQRTEIPLHELAEGIYLIRLRVGAGQVVLRKIVVER